MTRTFALKEFSLLLLMALYKIILKEGETDPVSANDYFELNGYTIFVKGGVKDVAIESKLIEEIIDITDGPPQETFTPFLAGGDID